MTSDPRRSIRVVLADDQELVRRGFGALIDAEDGLEVVGEVRNEPSSAHASRRAVPSTGVGIVGMRERAESVGGRLDAGSTPDGGFRVNAVVPYYRHGT